METKKITTGLAGYVGDLHTVEFSEPDSVLIFQLPRETKMLSDSYVQQAINAVKSSMPPGRQALVIGSDVNIYELTGADASILKLRGILL